MEGWIILFYSLFAWIVIVVFAVLPKKLPLAENTCVYFCTIILLISTFTTLGLNLQRFVYTDRLDFYFCREVGRIIIFPFLLLVFNNVFFTAKSAMLRWGTTLITYVVFCSVHFLYILIGDLSFNHWNSFLSMLMCALFMAAAWLFEKTFAYFFRKREEV